MVVCSDSYIDSLLITHTKKEMEKVTLGHNRIRRKRMCFSLKRRRERKIEQSVYSPPIHPVHFCRLYKQSSFSWEKTWLFSRVFGLSLFTSLFPAANLCGFFSLNGSESNWARERREERKSERQHRIQAVVYSLCVHRKWKEKVWREQS